jgi:energy-coupling factor transport system substrate-specific component
MAMVINNTVTRFLVCGGTAALINWLARIAFSSVMPFAPAIVAAYAIGMLAGFLLYRTWVWPASERSWQRQVMPFITVNLVGAGIVLVVALALVWLAAALSERNALTEAFAHGSAIAVGAVVNYVGHNRFTFTPRA